MRFFIAATLCAVGLVSGCSSGSNGPAIAAVKGKVIYQGKPVPRAIVNFLAKGQPVANGSTNDQGEFTLNTKGRSGAPIGECRVTVMAMEAAASSGAASGAPAIEPGSPEYLKMQTSAPPKAPKSLIPTKFQNAETSGITVTVDSDPAKNDLIVDLGA